MLIGAGSGLAPLMSIARYAAARNLDVPMSMLCSSRRRSTVLFEESLELHGLPLLDSRCLNHQRQSP